MRNEQYIPWDEVVREFARMGLMLAVAAADLPVSRALAASGRVWWAVAGNLVLLMWATWRLAGSVADLIACGGSR